MPSITLSRNNALASIPRLSLLVAGSLLLACGPAAATCVEDVFGEPMECQSEAVRVIDVVAEEVADDGCTGPHDTVTLHGRLKVRVNVDGDDDDPRDDENEILYDLGFFIGNDGEQALDGSCKVLTLGTQPQPYLDADNDNCGDTAGERTVLVPFRNLTLKCVDDNDNGRAELAACATWTDVASASCSGPHNARPGDETSCGCTRRPIDLDIPATGGNDVGRCGGHDDCPDDGVECTIEVCNPEDTRANDFGCFSLPRHSRCDDDRHCNGEETCDAKLDCRPGTPPDCNDDVACTIDSCNEQSDSCTHTADHSSCSDGRFCNGTETCTSLGCKPARQRACAANEDECTASSCNEATDTCTIIPHHNECDDANPCTTDTCDIHDGCRHVNTCNGDTDALCRAAGFWGTRAGSEGGGENSVQEIIDQAGELRVCGLRVDASVDEQSPWVEDLGLDSALEGLCVKTDGQRVRSLYRQLLTTALNCAVSDQDESCDDIIASSVGVSFEDCSELCSVMRESSVDGGQLAIATECIEQLDCFNKGGSIVAGRCARGTCSADSDTFCGYDYPACPDIDGDDQRCERFDGNCADADLCDSDLDLCSGNNRPSSTQACREARNNECTVESCD
ncbi:MAG TPA: hypothetical protein VEL28_15250 [Candidatus Binatia bacterium]|nr:hypothetical protein [Candidatus Binatia bacterium]